RPVSAKMVFSEMSLSACFHLCLPMQRSTDCFFAKLLGTETGSVDRSCSRKHSFRPGVDLIASFKNSKKQGSLRVSFRMEKRGKTFRFVPSMNTAIFTPNGSLPHLVDCLLGRLQTIGNSNGVPIAGTVGRGTHSKEFVSNT